ncbi:MAG: hypothetical protein C4576_09125 [Desulfobacteraceae bacterium]|nr:MAG: hypothetical protein C4576_09125 [Desulfobacteraceae bacterium]
MAKKLKTFLKSIESLPKVKDSPFQFIEHMRRSELEAISDANEYQAVIEKLRQCPRELRVFNTDKNGMVAGIRNPVRPHEMLYCENAKELFQSIAALVYLHQLEEKRKACRVPLTVVFERQVKEQFDRMCSDVDSTLCTLQTVFGLRGFPIRLGTKTRKALMDCQNKILDKISSGSVKLKADAFYQRDLRFLLLLNKSLPKASDYALFTIMARVYIHFGMEKGSLKQCLETIKQRCYRFLQEVHLPYNPKA